MSNVTASMVKELRERTGVGMGKCKKALDEAGGDIEEAINILRKSGMASAVKKGGRETNEGMVAFAEDSDNFALLEVNVETDFVVQNERFQEFTQLLCKELLKNKSVDIDSFLQSKSEDGRTIDELRAENIQSLGENIVLKRLLLISKDGNRSIGVYSHMNGKIVSAIEIDGATDKQDLARAIAMHVAAEFPEYLSESEVPADVKQREEEIAKSQVQNKPENIQEKIIQGKLNSFYDQVCLLRQKYIRDTSQSVGKVVESEGKDLTLKSFIRWQVGV